MERNQRVHVVQSFLLDFDSVLLEPEPTETAEHERKERTPPSDEEAHLVMQQEVSRFARLLHEGGKRSRSTKVLAGGL